VSVVEQKRLISLDQFRGYTVFGMLLVNFVGGYKSLPSTLSHHHTYCSYADTIMPQFLLAAGFAARLTWQREPRVRRIIVRTLGLMIVGLLLYGIDGRVTSWSQLQELGLSGFLQQAFQRNYFQTLVHIALVGLWVWPVLGCSAWIRTFWMIGSALLFHLVSEYGGYYSWVMKRPGIDGGPLGFLTWTIAYTIGTLACDWVMNSSLRGSIRKLLVGGAVVMLIGYGFSCLNHLAPPNSQSIGNFTLIEPPFQPPSEPVNIWTMSQRAGSVSYITFASGFGLAVLALFVAVCDGFHVRWSYLDLFGQNALAAYIIHSLADGPLSAYCPKDSPAWYVLIMFGLFIGLISVCLVYLRNHKLFLRM
jgi:predicted acyltransferase